MNTLKKIEERKDTRFKMESVESIIGKEVITVH